MNVGDGLLQDLRYAVRLLLKAPAFTAVAALSLGLGIGGNTAIFGVVNALFFMPLPVADPESVVAVYTSDFSGPRYGNSSHPDFLDLRDEPGLFDSLAAYSFEPLALMTEREPSRVWSELVSGDYFSTLGVGMALGRGLGLPDDAENAAPAAVLGHGLWKRRFGGDESFLGRSLTLSGTVFTVVGVAPEGFTGMRRGVAAEVWVPLAMRQRVGLGGGASQRGSRFLSILGRLRPGVTSTEAQARLDVLASQLRAAYPDQWTDLKGQTRRLSLLREDQARVEPHAQAPLMGFSALLALVVGAVLLIACANVANLMLARASTRRREIAVRLSLGASRGRLVRQFLTESVLVAALGGALGTLFAFWASDTLSALQPPLPVPVQLDVALDARVLAFALGLTLATGVLLGLAPALQASRPDLVPALRDEGGGGTTGARGRWLRRAFVTAQVALSLMLLAGAGLLLRGLARATTLSPGFDPEGVQVVSVDLGLTGYELAEATALVDQLAERGSRLPGVRAASLTVTLPLDLHAPRRGTRVEGYERRPGEDMEFHFGVVGPGYFDAMRIELLRGRPFGPEDRADAPGVVIVNESFAERFWPGQDPIGKTIQIRGDRSPRLSVVGLARDSKYRTLAEESAPYYYLPILQDYGYALRFTRLFPASLVARTTGDPATAVRAITAALAEIDSRLPVYPAKSMLEHMGLSVLPSRVAGALFAGFGLLGVALASLGLYGVVAYAVSQRTREIGVRIALGASAQSVFSLVLRDALSLVGVGMLIGTLLAAVLAQALRGLIYGLSPVDPVTFVGVPLLLTAVALLASALPARRATKVDPIVALRYE